MVKDRGCCNRLWAWQIDKLVSWLELLRPGDRRLMDDKYLNVYLDRESRSKLQMAIAYEHYLLGLSVRAIAEKLKVSRATVRKTIRELGRGRATK